MSPPDLQKLLSRAADLLLDRIDVEVGTTPHEVAWTENKARLLRYDSGARAHAVPILLIPSMVNRHYIFDLTAENSIARALLAGGYDCFLLDWGRPTSEDRLIGMEEYIEGLLARAVRQVLAVAGRKAVTLVGYCMGGTMSISHAALHPGKVRNLVLLATPVFFEKAGKLRTWSTAFDADLFAAAYGNAPPRLLAAALGMLVPSWQARQWAMFWRLADNDVFYKQFSAVARWVGDNVDIPERAFVSFARDFYQEDRLSKGRLRIGGRPVLLESVTASVLNVVASKDHIVPPEASLGLAGRVGSRDVTERLFDCGHVGLSIGSEAHPVVWPAIMEWIGERSAE